MNRTGLNLALLIAAAAGLVFGPYPELDLALSAAFFDHQQREFIPRWVPALGHVRDLAMWVVVALAAPMIAALVLKMLRPRSRLIVPGRAVVFLFWTLVLAPGVLANLVLKENWGRARPVQVTQFSGEQRFTPWWDSRGACPKNCSFVTGEGAGAFWALAPAALTPPQWRPLAYGAALGFGVAVSGLRVGVGAHFVSDVVFAGVFTFLVIWLVHGLVYRWRRTRQSDEEIERRMERLMVPLHDYLWKRIRSGPRSGERRKQARDGYPAPSATATL